MNTDVAIDTETVAWLVGVYLEQHGWHHRTTSTPHAWTLPRHAAGLTLGQALHHQFAGSPPGGSP